MQRFISRISVAVASFMLMGGLVFAPAAMAEFQSVPTAPGAGGTGVGGDTKIDPNTGQPMTAQGATGGSGETGAASGSRTAVCEGIEMATGSDCDDATAAKGVDNIIATVVNVLSIAVGIIAVIMIIIGGLKYITSSGDSNNVTSAKNTILYAVVGLVIVAIAQFIVKFVVTKATADPAAAPVIQP